MRERVSLKPKKTFSDKVDDVIGVFSPESALRRQAFRKALRIQASEARYRGASKDRLRASWLPGGGSADEDILPELATLRERSRDLVRNDPHAAGIIATVNVNTIGRGIRAQAKIDYDVVGVSEEEAEKIGKQEEAIWEEWMPEADAAGRMDFYEMQFLVDRQILENGEIFILPLMIDDSNRKFKTALQTIEADRVMTPFDQKQNKKIQYGIEMGERGQPLAYWVRKTHPGDLTVNQMMIQKYSSSNYERIPTFGENGRRNIYHLFWSLRSGQSRGVPFFAPAMNYFKDLADFMEAELVAARIAACFALLVKTEGNPYNAADARKSDTNASGQQIESLEPGMIKYLNSGEEVTQITPQRPGGSFEPFVDRILRAISASLNLPYEIVAKDFSKTNYSSARAALLEARRYFQMRQDWLARKFCAPVYSLVMEEAYLTGELPISGFYKKPKAWSKSRWIAPGWQWVDPLKEAEASIKAIDAGITTHAEVAAAQGNDWQEVIDQRAKEEKYIKDIEKNKDITIRRTEKATTPQQTPPKKRGEEDDDEQED